MILPRLGWVAVDPVTTRLVAAALLAIGVQSWRGRHAGVEAYRTMLGLKVVWSTAAIVGLTIAIARGAPPVAFLCLAVFLAFCGVWSHHAIRFRQLGRAPIAAESEDAVGDDDPPPPA
jgi:type III secretory pathway component EscV